MLAGKMERKYLAHYIDASFGSGVYVKTTDTAIQSGKTYYTLTGTAYTAVASPVLASIEDYYEKVPNYVILGHDLEEYSEELNPNVEVTTNILGEQSVTHSGYEVSSDVDPFYAYEGDPLFEHLSEIANERLTGTACITTKVDVLVDAQGTVVWAYREDVYVVPNSLGGDTSGVQIPFAINNAGNRVRGTWNTTTKTFTPETVSG